MVICCSFVKFGKTLLLNVCCVCLRLQFVSQSVELSWLEKTMLVTCFSYQPLLTALFAALFAVIVGFFFPNRSPLCGLIVANIRTSNEHDTDESLQLGRILHKTNFLRVFKSVFF